MKRETLLIIVCFLSAYGMLGGTQCLANVPSLINYQGVLKHSTGTPYDTTANMTFSIWDDSTGGNKLWEEGQEDVLVSHGLFNVLLGSSIPIPDSVFGQPDAWLQVTVGEGELSPRRRIVSVGYAYRASVADVSTYSDTANYSFLSNQSLNSYNSDSLQGYTAEMIFNMSQVRPLNAMDEADNTVVSIWVSGAGSYETKRSILIPENSLTQYIIVGFNLRATADTPHDLGETNTVTPYGRITVNGVPVFEVVGPSAFQMFGSGSATRFESFGLTGVYKYKIAPPEVDFSVANTLTFDLKAVVQCPTPECRGNAYSDYWEVWGK